MCVRVCSYMLMHVKLDLILPCGSLGWNSSSQSRTFICGAILKAPFRPVVQSHGGTAITSIHSQHLKKKLNFNLLLVLNR